MWLADDAVLKQNWAVVLAEHARQGSLNGCLTALHACNCHSCTEDAVYNGVGMVVKPEVYLLY